MNMRASVALVAFLASAFVGSSTAVARDLNAPVGDGQAAAADFAENSFVGSIDMALRFGRAGVKPALELADLRFASPNGRDRMAAPIAVYDDQRGIDPLDSLFRTSSFMNFRPSQSASASKGSAGFSDLQIGMAGALLVSAMMLAGLSVSRPSRRTGGTAPMRAYSRVAIDRSSFVPAPAVLAFDDTDLPRMRPASDRGMYDRDYERHPSPGAANKLPETGLSEFRLFRLNATGLVDQAETGMFDNVDLAVRRAAIFGEGSPVEVWQGRQRVTVVVDQTAGKGDTDYVFQEIGAGGGVPMLLRQEFASDSAAMAHAHRISNGSSVEVRSFDRLVGTVRSGAPG